MNDNKPYEVYKEKYINGQFHYIYGTTVFFDTYQGAKAYAQGLKFLLKNKERYTILHRKTSFIEYIYKD